MTAASSLGTAIKRARERRRWSQRELADKLGVDIKSISNWETGRTTPKSSIGALEDVLGISLTAEPEPEMEAWRDPTDQWEAGVLADPYLDDEDKQWLIESSRSDRLARVAARRARRAIRAAAEASRDEGLSDRRTAGG